MAQSLIAAIHTQFGRNSGAILQALWAPTPFRRKTMKLTVQCSGRRALAYILKTAERSNTRSRSPRTSRRGRRSSTENLRRIRKVGRKEWKREGNYHRRSLAADNGLPLQDDLRRSVLNIHRLPSRFAHSPDWMKLAQ